MLAGRFGRPGKTKDRVNMLGGAFHLYHTFNCFDEAWPYPAKVVDATLATQRADGMWEPYDGECTALVFRCHPANENGSVCFLA